MRQNLTFHPAAFLTSARSQLYDFLRSDVSRLYPDLRDFLSVSLVEAGPALLGPFEEGLRDYVARLFVKRDIKLMLGTSVTKVKVGEVEGWKHESTSAVLSSGEELPFGTMVWSAGLSPVKVTDKLDLKKEGGRVVTDEFLRVKGHEGKVWAIGDCAIVEKAPLPQLAQVAQQQAQYLGPILDGRKGEDEKEVRWRRAARDEHSESV